MPDKPGSMDKQVSKVFDELKDGVTNHSIRDVLTEINNDKLDMTRDEWSKFSSALQQKIAGCGKLLPELTILATEQEFSPKLANGKTIDDQVILSKLDTLKTYSEDCGKTSFTQTLLQSFLDDDYKRVENETTPGRGTCVSSKDLEMALKEDQFNEVQDKWGKDAITLLEKNGAKDFVALADQNMHVTEESIKAALKKDVNGAAEGLPPILDAETRDLASDLLTKRNDAFKRFGDGDEISLKSLGDAAAKQGVSVDELRAAKGADDAKPTPKGDGADKSDPAGKESKDGKPGKETEKSDKPGSGKPEHEKGWFERNFPGASRGTSDGKEGSHATEKHAPPAVNKPVEQSGVYKVHRGDNLTSIARHVLNVEHKAVTPDSVKEMISEIATKNGIENINLIRDGQVLHF